MTSLHKIGDCVLVLQQPRAVVLLKGLVAVHPAQVRCVQNIVIVRSMALAILQLALVKFVL